VESEGDVLRVNTARQIKPAKKGHDDVNTLRKTIAGTGTPTIRQVSYDDVATGSKHKALKTPKYVILRQMSQLVVQGLGLRTSLIMPLKTMTPWSPTVEWLMTTRMMNTSAKPSRRKLWIER